MIPTKNSDYEAHYTCYHLKGMIAIMNFNFHILRQIPSNHVTEENYDIVLTTDFIHTSMYTHINHLFT